MEVESRPVVTRHWGGYLERSWSKAKLKQTRRGSAVVLCHRSMSIVNSNIYFRATTFKHNLVHGDKVSETSFRGFISQGKC